CGEIAGAQGLDQCNGFRVEWWKLDLIRQRIRPLCALFDPGLDGVDLFGAQRTGRRHLHPVLIAGDPKEEQAVFDVAGQNAASAEDFASAIEAESAALLRGAVAADAIL